MKDDVPLLIFIQGRRGTGKSLFATAVTMSYPHEVMANFKIDVPNYKRISFTDIVKHRKQRLVILDEAYNVADSRRSGSNINVILSHFVFQSRKLKADLIIICQENSSIDLRLRDLADFIIETRLVKDGFDYDVYDPYDNYITTYHLDYDYAEKELFNKYDSYDLIEDNKDLGNELSIIEPGDKNKAIDELIQQMREEISLENWTKDMIKDLLKEHRYPVNEYINDVYGRVKRILAAEKEPGTIRKQKRKIIHGDDD